MAHLKVVISKNLVEDVTLTGPLVIGRGTSVDVALLDSAVSRAHARIEPRDGGWWLADLGSANGTLVCNARVAESVLLREGDVIQIGAKILVFTLEAAAGAPQRTLDWRGGTPGPAELQAAEAQTDLAMLLPSHEATIEEAATLLRRLVSLGPLSLLEAEGLLTAAREALANAMHHGNSDVRARTVEARCTVEAERVRIAVRDEGKGFDYREAMQAGRTRPAMELARARYEQGGVGGLGIMLMLRSVDLVEYNAAGNQVTLTKWRGDFFRDETVLGGLGLSGAPGPVAPAPGTADAGTPPHPRHPTVRFEPATDDSGPVDTRP